ncbi:MAG TPA: malto-oligosyltrehalose trehalohydrolase [Terriglobales bacterium]|nr:malto-oligosyltrehalose trehalohydrolase [Terriglobales bacterium]
MNGANWNGNGTDFRVWAPKAERVTLRQLGKGDREMKRGKDDVFTLSSADARPGDRYFYLVNDEPLQLPDPVSRLLPEGVHGPTEIVDASAFPWSDAGWTGVDYRDYILYELHVGTFTPEGTFDGVIGKLDYLKELGITAIELLPLAAFPGKRNWGYDGVSMYAVQESYGGPEGLKRLVDAAHGKGIAVVIDVVYNHLGAEGNYLSKFGPYFTCKHHTPWGDAINYDDKGSQCVREYVIENALYWIREYHADGLRLDAVHTIKDDSQTHIIAELRDRVQQFATHAGRKVALMAESDENSPKYVRPRGEGGYGLEGLWSDDFHHALHTHFTGEGEGYYQDFGALDDLIRAINEGFVFQGQDFKFWGKPRGESSQGMRPESHVICIQNHDQVGNRATGDRLTSLVTVVVRKLMAALLLLAPQTPLLWMGQESDEPNPFQFFTDYGDPQMKKAVTEGRRKEFEEFSSFAGEVPDPQDPATFERSKLSWQLTPEREEMLSWYRELITLRKALYQNGERSCRVTKNGEKAVVMRVPAETPLMELRADWSGEGIGSEKTNWREMLSVDDESCRLSIRVSPELEDKAKRLCA